MTDDPRSKVLFVLPNFAGGGAERVALLLLANLDRQFFSPHLAVVDKSGPLQHLLTSNTVLHEIGKKRLRNALPALIRLIRRERPSIVFASQGYLNIALLMTKVLMPRGTKIAVREASTPSLILANRERSWLMTKAYRQFYPWADLVFCQHRQTEQEMTASFGVPTTHIVSLPNPVPVADLRKQAVPVARHQGTGRRFVAAGRLSKEKGFDRLVELCATLPSDVHLTIYGEGEERARLGELVAELGLKDRIALAGFTNSLPAALAGADACVISSHWEGLPNVALESLACGTPVIATPESGGVADLAKTSPPGAVRIAAWGDTFRDQLAAFQPRATTTLAPSLLPSGYALEQVAGIFNDKFIKLANRIV